MPNFTLFADTYNGTGHVDMGKYVLAGHVVIALKASEGKDFIDGLHAVRAREAHAVGLTVIHYHFCRPDKSTSPQDEARQFVRVVRPTWQKGDYLWADMERHVSGRREGDTQWVEEFCRTVHSEFGATPIVYASESTLNEGLSRLRVKGERYAPAKYGGSPTRLALRRHKWSEQYTDGEIGHGPHAATGIGQCDMNTLNWRTAVVLRTRTTWRRWRPLHPRRKG